ncbi:MAG: sterol-binding protein [Bacteroidetes bacterium]|nr:sterol-binding protein [Rhodothermaceae bacterium RA]RMH51373.1 MAG: sterol-binding protein [Bacteroidota bacterium]
MPRLQTIPELLAFYQERFIPERAEGIDGVVVLDLSGEGGGTYSLIIQNQTLTIEEGARPDPTVTVRASAADWLAIHNGEINPMMAMMQGKVKIKGSMAVATRFQGMFRIGGG